MPRQRTASGGKKVYIGLYHGFLTVRPHRMYDAFEMRIIATDDPVAWCVRLSVTRLHTAQTAELIEVLFEVESPEDPWNTARDGGPDPPMGRAVWREFYPLLCEGN